MEPIQSHFVFDQITY